MNQDNNSTTTEPNQNSISPEIEVRAETCRRSVTSDLLAAIAAIKKRRGYVEPTTDRQLVPSLDETTIPPTEAELRHERIDHLRHRLNTSRHTCSSDVEPIPATWTTNQSDVLYEPLPADRRLHSDEEIGEIIRRDIAEYEQTCRRHGVPVLAWSDEKLQRRIENLRSIPADDPFDRFFDSHYTNKDKKEDSLSILVPSNDCQKKPSDEVDADFGPSDVPSDVHPGLQSFRDEEAAVAAKERQINQDFAEQLMPALPAMTTQDWQLFDNSRRIAKFNRQAIQEGKVNKNGKHVTSTRSAFTLKLEFSTTDAEETVHHGVRYVNFQNPYHFTYDFEYRYVTNDYINEVYEPMRKQAVRCNRDLRKQDRDVKQIAMIGHFERDIREIDRKKADPRGRDRHPYNFAVMMWAGDGGPHIIVQQGYKQSNFQMEFKCGRTADPKCAQFEYHARPNPPQATR